MPFLPEKDRTNLESGLETIRKIETFVDGIESAEQFYEQVLVFDATLMNFVVIGEIVDKISAETQKRYPGIPWPKIKSFRNIIAHTYFGVDYEEVWQIINRNLPALKEQFQQILDENS